MGLSPDPREREEKVIWRHKIMRTAPKKKEEEN
jgi:hypothetical protein